MEESGHWYNRDGSPCYEVRGNNGKMRAFNLRWDRGLGAVPSVTTVLKIIDKPALTNWLVDQGIMAALTLPRVDGEPEDAYIARVRDDSKQQAIKAAQEGTRIHDAIEHYWKTGGYVDGYELHTQAAVARIRELFPNVNDWVAEVSFAHPLGFGGKVDLHSPSTGIVVDYKGKDGDFTDGKRLAYDQHWQLAAYQVGLGLAAKCFLQSDSNPELDAEWYDGFHPCANIFVSRTHPGYAVSHGWSSEEIRSAWKIFSATLFLWKLLKNYDGSF
jgi:hypothetical protein